MKSGDAPEPLKMGTHSIFYPSFHIQKTRFRIVPPSPHMPPFENSKYYNCMGSRESGSSRFALRRSPRLLGLSIPESGSRQLALRRSSRLLGKPAMNVPQLSQIKPRKPCKPRGHSKPHKHRKPLKHSKPPKRRGAYRRFTLAEIMRHTLNTTVQSFLSCHKSIGAYPYGDVEKTCIYSGGSFSSVEKNTPTGFTWVAVHGLYSTCAVFKKDADAARRAYRDPEIAGSFYDDIGLIAISEMADLADKEQTITKPFAVVSVISGTANVHKVSSEKAVDFVQNKIGSGLPSTDTESIEIAIGALQLVWKQKFNASDIWVSVWHPIRPTFLFTWRIEKHLANINRPGSEFYTEEHLAWINRPGSEGCIEEHLADISGPDGKGLTEEHSPGNGGCVEEHWLTSMGLMV